MQFISLVLNWTVVLIDDYRITFPAFIAFTTLDDFFFTFLYFFTFDKMCEINLSPKNRLLSHLWCFLVFFACPSSDELGQAQKSFVQVY